MATAFSVRAHAGKGRFSLSVISESPLVLRAGIAAPAEDGKANRELLSGLERLLGCPVRLVAGQRSRRKTLAAECEAAAIIGKVKQLQKQR
jgi:uncharacterized protein (TIGR00251 family)